MRAKTPIDAKHGLQSGASGRCRKDAQIVAPELQLLRSGSMLPMQHSRGSGCELINAAFIGGWGCKTEGSPYREVEFRVRRLRVIALRVRVA